jgi:hypothetical protein
MRWGSPLWMVLGLSLALVLMLGIGFGQSAKLEEMKVSQETLVRQLADAESRYRVQLAECHAINQDDAIEADECQFDCDDRRCYQRCEECYHLVQEVMRSQRIKTNRR